MCRVGHTNSLDCQRKTPPVTCLYSHLFIVAAALHMACVIQQKDVRQWFAELAVDLEKVWICLPFH